MDKNILAKTAKAMVAPGKGILAIDESHSTCRKRFDAYKIECTEDNRRAYRELLIAAPEIEKYISGMILFDETLRQKTADGTPFPQILKNKGIIPGIKVDAGVKDLGLHAGEKITEGLDGLRERLAEYKTLGAGFAKWRAVITIDEGIPSLACIKANSHALARYAALCQEQDIVPIVEPEVLMDGGHTIERCYEATAQTLKTLFAELAEQGVIFEGTVLKASMVLSGKDCKTQASVPEVATQTIACLKESVPQALAGIVFLSGGQTDEKATAHLDAMNRMDKALPWPLSFSYGRALQSQALKIWAINKDIARAQKALVHRSHMNGLAALGKYDEKLEH
ncbi:fructose-bisphosphate aldolase class I [Candidatus Peregrinibacteria bacterium]|nr:fructose-bisphosphate aldolase class I [Candidatus Peregrinibacteria bacterium]